jgi:ribonuclease P protein component
MGGGDHTGQGFPRPLRLRRSGEFRDVFDRGRSSSDARLIVYARPREEGRPARLGLVIGRRFGNSPARNAWKRRVREAFRLTRDRLPAGHDLVVLPARGGQVPGAREIERSLVRVAARAADAYRRRGPR